MHPSLSLSFMKKVNLKDIQDFIKSVAQTGASEIDIKTKEFELSVKFCEKEQVLTDNKTFVKPSVNHQQEVSLSNIAHEEETKITQNDNYQVIKASMVGTFYRKPSPDKANFVSEGDTIKVGDIICIIEAMKLFNEIEAEISGKIVKILVEDSTPIEFDQDLFLIEPF